ncbi:MAG TPA: hypothetical protein VFT22_04140 [Kofleriaceae bacterium]|nr:hypothetical protein [Kofleriaceae bacterium]
MAPLVAHPPSSAVAEPIPTGVATPDGRLYLVASPDGIDAVDSATGATAWSTGAAAIPILALPDTLLAIRGADAGDGAWAGPGTLVAIELAAPHAARTGAPFELPLARHRLLDVRIAGGALLAGWHARGEPRGFTAAPSPLTGGLRVDLATGGASVLDRDQVPEAARAAIAGQTLWSPAGRGSALWFADGGWSAVLLTPADGGRAPTLHHWAPDGRATATRLVEPADVDRASVEDVDAHRLYLRVCEPEAPRCELRVLDAATGALLAAIADPAPSAPRLEPPFAYIPPTLVATRSAPGQRALVAFDVALAHERWRRPMLPRPLPVRRP